MLGDDSHYLGLGAAFCRGRLGPGAPAEDRAAIEAGLAAGLRLHRFKRTAELPRVRRVLGALRSSYDPISAAWYSCASNEKLRTESWPKYGSRYSDPIR